MEPKRLKTRRTSIAGDDTRHIAPNSKMILPGRSEQQAKVNGRSRDTFAPCDLNCDIVHADLSARGNRKSEILARLEMVEKGKNKQCLRRM